MVNLSPVHFSMMSRVLCQLCLSRGYHISCSKNNRNWMGVSCVAFFKCIHVAYAAKEKQKKLCTIAYLSPHDLINKPSGVKLDWTGLFVNLFGGNSAWVHRHSACCHFSPHHPTYFEQSQDMLFQTSGPRRCHLPCLVKGLTSTT